MKKLFSLVSVAMLSLAFIATLQLSSVNAEGAATGTVIVHYHQWDGDYTDVNAWLWGTGTDGTVPGDGLAPTGTDDFGIYWEISVNPTDANDSFGFIMREGYAWSGDNWTDREGVDFDGEGGKDDRAVDITPIKNGDTTTMDVYFIEGAQDPIYVGDTDAEFGRTGTGSLVVVYYDPTLDPSSMDENGVGTVYTGWNLWTWGTGTHGTITNPVDFKGNLSINGGTYNMFRVAVINIDSDADDSMGFIVRDDAWNKKFPDDIYVDISGIKGSGFDFKFYIAGKDSLFDDYASFEAEANAFKFEDATALSPIAIPVEFNKEVNHTHISADGFIITDKDGNTLSVDNIAYDSTLDSTKKFVVTLADPMENDKAPFTIQYDDGTMTSEIADVAIDSQAPTIELVSGDTINIELGDVFALPAYVATDDRDGTITQQVYVPEGMGFVNTGVAGAYTVTLRVADQWGNVTDHAVTVNVTDPCADFVPELISSGLSTGAIIGIVLGSVAVVGAGVFIFLKRGM